MRASSGSPIVEREQRLHRAGREVDLLDATARHVARAAVAEVRVAAGLEDEEAIERGVVDERRTEGRVVPLERDASARSGASEAHDLVGVDVDRDD